jgi:hypothetical protein
VLQSVDDIDGQGRFLKHTKTTHSIKHLTGKHDVDPKMYSYKILLE